MEEKEILLKKAESKIEMIKRIIIGDPSYFDDAQGLKHTYTKSFRGKSDWVGKLELIKNKTICPIGEYNKEELEFEDIAFKLYLAYDEKMLSLLLENKFYSTQKEKLTELGVDTASYLLQVDKKEDIIKIGGDGSIGYVCEYYTKNKLDAVVMEVTMPTIDGDDFNRNKKTLEWFFNCSLEEVEI